MSVNYQGVEYDELPDFAREAMAENLSKTLNRWFSARPPEEYEAFVKEMERMRRIRETESSDAVARDPAANKSAS